MISHILVTLLAMHPSAQAQSLLGGGACPGAFDLTITGLSPDGDYVIITADDVGATVIPGGPCAGTIVDLGAGLKVRRQARADAAGNVQLSPNLPAAVCDAYIQVVDVATCSVSPVGHVGACANNGVCSVSGLDWEARPDAVADCTYDVGELRSFACPAGGYASATIWGTDVYTHDSATCVAAVHAGVIDLATGGPVLVQIAPGEASYVGSYRNGIQSESWDVWPCSYVFP